MGDFLMEQITCDLREDVKPSSHCDGKTGLVMIRIDGLHF